MDGRERGGIEQEGAGVEFPAGVMVQRYSHEASTEQARVFHEETSRSIARLRTAADALSRQPGEDLAAAQRKRKQRGHIDQAIRAIEVAQRIGMTTGDPDHRTDFPGLTKQSLRHAVLDLKSLDKVASHFGMAPGAIRRMMQMFYVEPNNPESFYGDAA